MKYRVRWLPTAEDELTRIWLRSSDRSVVRTRPETSMCGLRAVLQRKVNLGQAGAASYLRNR